MLDSGAEEVIEQQIDFSSSCGHRSGCRKHLQSRTHTKPIRVTKQFLDADLIDSASYQIADRGLMFVEDTYQLPLSVASLLDFSADGIEQVGFELQRSCFGARESEIVEHIAPRCVSYDANFPGHRLPPSLFSAPP
jgi:hypothetical protein